MRVDVLTREYPPEVYGSAGAHVAELVHALRSSVDVRVRCFGADRDDQQVSAYSVPLQLVDANPALGAIGVDLEIAASTEGADVIHSHTWYANLAGHLASLMHGIPHVVTAHSLEPLRPWKAQQLGGGYRISSWIEQTAFAGAHAIIATSQGMSADILQCYPFVDPAIVRVIHNGIDVSQWSPLDEPDRLRALGIDPDRQSVVFVEPSTPQHGLDHLLAAARSLPAHVQLVLCTGAPGTPVLPRETQAAIAELQSSRGSVVWIDGGLSRRQLRAILSSATTLACPVVDESVDAVLLQSMACGTPVVGVSAGSIPEFVDDGVTGVVVPFEQTRDGSGQPADPDGFVRDLADSLNEMVSNAARAEQLGQAGRARAEERFGWERIAAATAEVYRSLR